MTDEYSAGPYIMLETLRQLSIEASSTFQKIFEALNGYLDARRGKSAVVRRELPTLGSGLGLCYHALSHFGKELMGRVQSVSKPIVPSTTLTLSAAAACWPLRCGPLPITTTKSAWGYL